MRWRPFHNVYNSRGEPGLLTFCSEKANDHSISNISLQSKEKFNIQLCKQPKILKVNIWHYCVGKKLYFYFKFTNLHSSSFIQECQTSGLLVKASHLKVELSLNIFIKRIKWTILKSSWSVATSRPEKDTGEADMKAHYVTTHLKVTLPRWVCKNMHNACRSCAQPLNQRVPDIAAICN